jgi:branched-chain amino acid aminotransferase
VPWRNATTHVLTHSLHYGLAVFEGVRAYNTDNGTAIFRLKEHTERWFNSAKIYMMKMPYDSKTLMQAHVDVVRANKLVDCYLRPIAFYGSEKMGVSPKGASVHVAIAAWPWGAYLGADGLEKGIRVKTSSYSRHHVNVNMARAKFSGTYANSILANLEATEHGYDEALLLDTDGFVAEGAGENLFVIKDGKIYEPEIASALVGITRGTIIQLAKELGYETEIFDGAFDAAVQYSQIEDVLDLTNAVVFHMFVADRIKTITIEHCLDVTLLKRPQSILVKNIIDVTSKLDRIGEIVEHRDRRDNLVLKPKRSHCLLREVCGCQEQIRILACKLTSGRIAAVALQTRRVHLQKRCIVASDIQNSITLFDRGKKHNLVIVLAKVSAHRSADSRAVSVHVLVHLGSGDKIPKLN